MSQSSQPDSDPARRSMSRAWWSLVLFVPAFVLAFVVGEGIPALFGYDDPSATATPLGVMLLAFGAATVVLALPLPLVHRLSQRAREHNAAAARAPFFVAAAVVSGFVAMNLLGLVAQLVAG